MKWFFRGVQSAIFHYISCAPCADYARRNKRKKQAKKVYQGQSKVASDEDVYAHPPPTGVNPYWAEEIAMGPGPPPRRKKRTNTAASSQRDPRSAIVSQTGSSLDVQSGSSLDVQRIQRDAQLSDDTLSDEKWNRRRYQREDEDLWGTAKHPSPPRAVVKRGSSVGLGGSTRPETSKSSSSHYILEPTPKQHEIFGPVVDLPYLQSLQPSDTHWMLQPPPKATIMSGKERANRSSSRTASGASSRVELRVQRGVSETNLRRKLVRRETAESAPIRQVSDKDPASLPRHSLPRTAHLPPALAGSPRRGRKRRDTAIDHGGDAGRSSPESSDTVVRGSGTPRNTHRSGMRSPAGLGRHDNSSIPHLELSTTISPPPPAAKPFPVSSQNGVRTQKSLQRLSTIVSSDSDKLEPTRGTRPSVSPNRSSENTPISHPQPTSQSQLPESTPYIRKTRIPPNTSDISSLKVLQELVPTRLLLGSRFVSSPLPEARIRLPPEDREEEKALNGVGVWDGGGVAKSRTWEDSGDTPPRVDGRGDDGTAFKVAKSDAQFRWSVDF